MANVTTEEGRVLWFLQSVDPVSDPKALLDEKHRSLVDALATRGLLKQVWILSEEGHRIADAAWLEHDKKLRQSTANFKLR